MEHGADILEVKKEIKKLNNAQFGSFGEFVFAHYILNIRIEKLQKVHKDDTDFLYGGRAIDVGASRALNKTFKVIEIAGKDIHVHFFSDCCSINYPGHFNYQMDWEAIIPLFNAWEKDHRIKVKNVHGRSYSLEYEEIKVQISRFFEERGFKPRIIYRTVSHGFGLGESPDNLLPNKIYHGNVTVYIDFNDKRRTRDNIRVIIAFPDERSAELPRQEKVTIRSGRENLEKADLTKIMESNHTCFFRDIEELNGEFFNRFFKIY